MESIAGKKIALLPSVSRSCCIVIKRPVNPDPLIREFTKGESKWLNPSQQEHHNPIFISLWATRISRAFQSKVNDPKKWLSFFSHAGELCVNYFIDLSTQGKLTLIGWNRAGSNTVPLG